jgi:cephalosporin-C deacetylase-like acetyl esterase
MRLARLIFCVFLVHASSFAFADASDSRGAFLRLIDRPRVDLAPTVKTISESAELKRYHFTYASEAQQRVPGLLFKSNTRNGRQPVIIVLHGTGGTKEGAEVVAFCERLVREGLICASIDGRYHGERTIAGTGAAEYNEAIARAWRTGQEHPFYYDTVWDVMRLVDYLQTRDDIDPKRIGLTGISKGGIETYLTAAVDTRIAAAVPLIGVQSFKWALDNGQWKARIATIQSAFDAAAKEANRSNADVAFVREFYDRVVPSIYEQFDGPSMLPLIAPRPLLVINGDSDANTPIAGVRLSIEAAKSAYADKNATDRVVLSVQENTGHTVNPKSVDATVAWFVKWLQPTNR